MRNYSLLNDPSIAYFGYVIDRVDWHQQTEGNLDSEHFIQCRFRTLVNFLNQYSLVNREIKIPEESIPAGFEIHSSYLTEIGLEFIEIAYDEWLECLDDGMDPSESSYLEKQLEYISQIYPI